MKGLLIWATSLIVAGLFAPASAAQGDDAKDIEMAAVRFAQAASGGDFVEMYARGSTEMRAWLRFLVGMEGMMGGGGARIDISRIDDADGFAQAVRDGGQRFQQIRSDLDRGVMPPGFLRFTRVVAVEVNGDQAQCFVFDAETERRRNEAANAMRETARTQDVSTAEKLLITKPPAPARAEPAIVKPDPRKESTGVLFLRRENKEWKVSTTAPVGVPPGPQFAPPAPQNPGTPAQDAGEKMDLAPLEAPVGKTTVRKVVESTTASRRTAGGPKLLDVFGPMTEDFKKFVVAKLGRPIAHSHIDLSFTVGGPGEIFLLNPSEPTVGDMGGITDKALWEMMVEYVEKNPR